MLPRLDGVEGKHLLHVEWLRQVSWHLLLSCCGLGHARHRRCVVEKLRAGEEELLVGPQRDLLSLLLARLPLELHNAALGAQHYLLVVAAGMLA